MTPAVSFESANTKQTKISQTTAFWVHGQSKLPNGCKRPYCSPRHWPQNHIDAHWFHGPARSCPTKETYPLNNSAEIDTKHPDTTFK